MTLAITGGGTGGHLSIAKALGLQANKMGIEVIYIGSTLGQDRDWFEKSPIFSHKYFLQSKSVVNKPHIFKLLAFLHNILLAKKSIKILRSHKVDALISVGGFSASSSSFASLMLKIPLFIHEQNASAGSLNTLLKPFCSIFFSSFKYKNALLVPYPVEEVFFNNYKITTKIESILFLGGSQGARAINNYALLNIKKLNEKGIRVIHQCGKNEFLKVKDEYEKLGIDFVILDSLDSTTSKDVNILFPFTHNLSSFIKASSFCISRCGAGSIFELCASGVSALFIPYPYASKNHQYFNAKALVDEGLALLCEEKDLLIFELDSIFSLNLEHISKGLKEYNKPDGAKQILQQITQKLSK